MKTSDYDSPDKGSKDKMSGGKHSEGSAYEEAHESAAERKREGDLPKRKAKHAKAATEVIQMGLKHGVETSRMDPHQHSKESMQGHHDRQAAEVADMADRHKGMPHAQELHDHVASRMDSTRNFDAADTHSIHRRMGEHARHLVDMGHKHLRVAHLGKEHAGGNSPQGSDQGLTGGPYA